MRKSQLFLFVMVVVGFIVFALPFTAQAKKKETHAEITGKPDFKARAEDLNENSNVAMAGLVSDGICERIRKELARKFKGQASPELLDLKPSGATWVAYSYLFKEIPFRWAFTRFHENLKFEGYHVDSFGISHLDFIQKDEVKMASQVAVLHHKDNDNLIIEIKTRAQDDRLILAKLPSQKTLCDTVNMVEKLIARGKPSEMREMEDLFVPVLNFDILRQYSKLYNHPIRSSNKKINGTKIEVAAQSIRFRLDERGAVLKSEAIATDGLTSRNLVFDEPFLILLKRGNAKAPYFALCIGNAELLVPMRKRALKDGI